MICIIVLDLAQKLYFPFEKPKVKSPGWKYKAETAKKTNVFLSIIINV